MEIPRQLFHNYPNIDPETGDKILIGSKKYLELVNKYGEPPKIISPKSGKKIGIGKGEYYKLIKEGYDESDLLLSISKVEKVKSPKTNKLITVGGKTYNDLIKQGYIKTETISELPVTSDVGLNVDLTRTSMFNELPDEIIGELINNTNLYDLLDLCKTNKRVNTLCQKNKNFRILIDNVKQKEVICGGNHAFILKDGILYGIGDNSYGQLGLSSNIKNTNKITEIIKGGVLLVACGMNYTMIVTKKGLYGTGDNSSGQLGIGDDRKKIFRFEKVDTTKIGTILSVSCGFNHTIIMSHQNDIMELYGFGSNRNGQLGDVRSIGSRFDIPTKINFNLPVISIICKYNYTLAITPDGCYTFGFNIIGPMGFIKTEPDNIQYYEKIPLNNVLSVSCGISHIMVHTTDGLYGLGMNRDGQIGIPNIGTANGYKIFKKVDIPGIIKGVECGQDYTIVMTDKGLYGFGDNKYGQLGIYNIDIVNTPQKIYNPEVSEVSCGEHFTLFKTMTNEYYSFGSITKNIDFKNKGKITHYNIINQ